MPNSNSPSESSQSASTQPSQSPTKNTPRAARSRSAEAIVVAAKALQRALTSAVLAAIAKADASRGEKRLDKAFVANFESVLAAVEKSVSGQAVFIHEVRAQTAGERATAKQLEGVLRKINKQVSTTRSATAQEKRAFGRGTVIDGRHTGPTIKLANDVQDLADSPAYSSIVDRAGLRPLLDQAAPLAKALSIADIGQHATVSAMRDGTVNKDSLLMALATLTSYARTVITDVFGAGSAEAIAASDTRPFVGESARRPRHATAATPSPSRRAGAKTRSASVTARKTKAVAAPTRASPAKKGGKKAKKGARASARKTKRGR